MSLNELKASNTIEENNGYVQNELTEYEKTPVFTYSSDKYYHLDSNCYSEKERPMVLLRKPAENCGYVPCPKCAAEK